MWLHTSTRTRAHTLILRTPPHTRARPSQTTGKSRGFGFVTLRTLDASAAVLASPPAEIDGRRVMVSLAALGPTGPSAGAAGGGYNHGYQQQQHMMAGYGHPQMGGAYAAYGAAQAAAAYGYGAVPPPQYQAWGAAVPTGAMPVQQPQQGAQQQQQAQGYYAAAAPGGAAPANYAGYPQHAGYGYPPQ